MDHGEKLPAATRVRKRRRARLVCNTCRDRKTRCNGERPACSSCVRRDVGDTCVYEDMPIGVRSRKSTTGSERISQLGSGDTPAVPSIPVHMVTQVSDTEPSDPVYGGSSTNLLVSHVQLATTEGNLSADSMAFPALTSEPGNQSRPRFNRYGLEIAHSQDISEFILPHRHAADEFLSCYWEFIHPIFPVLHKQTFLGLYKKLWMPAGDVAGRFDNSVGETIFHVSLNLVFALGCQFSNVIIPAKKMSCADEFYQRSRKLTNFEIMDSAQLSLVQMLLLTGIYLQSTEHVTRLWNVIGLAIRAAQCLGLHSNEASVHLESQLDREIRRRIWYNCVLLDELIAMTFGRPAMILGSWNVTAPSMIDDEYLMLRGDGMQPPNSPSRMGLFVYSLELFKITEEILSELYIRQDQGASPSEPYQGPLSPEQLLKVLSISAKLDRFDDTLPDFLRSSPLSGAESETSYNHLMLQARVLNSRYLYIRILLLRFVLLGCAEQYIKKPLELSLAKEPRLKQDFATSACTLCVNMTHTLLERLQESLSTPYRSPGWHMVYFAFASATVLIAAHICPLVKGDLEESSFMLSWSRAIAILNHHKAQIESAGRAIIVLEALKERVYSMAIMDSWDKWSPPIHDQGTNISSLVTETSGSTNLSTNETQFLTPELGGSGGIDLPQYDMDMVGIGSMNEAWFVEQLSDLNWLNLPGGEAP
ncbi:fungal-specific transcription factor domain-containing protein [Xylogone sp. PMI_703]|nr:fungal-specific transcription factor domain-containing protein [Xylogone sp. PMI_703]